MDLGLKNKVAMVGGASKGLGYAIAHALAAEGAQLCMASRDPDAIARAAQTIERETGSKTVAVAADRIRVNTLIPGRIATDRLQYLDEINAKKAGVALEEQQRRSLATVPLGRYGRPDEFGRVGAFLLSDSASYINGASIQVDGGMIRGLL